MSWYNPSTWDFGTGAGDPSNPTRASLGYNSQDANAFGNQGAAGYAANQAGIDQTIAGLRAQAAGQNSVSAEQLRQGLQQNLATQQSMAAGASPQNAAMAARNAAMNMGQQAYGMAGQQAVAGLAERNQAQQALAGLQLGQSGQNLQGALGGYGAANQGYGEVLGTPQKNLGQMAMGGLGGLAAGIIAKSDRRAKTDIHDADDDANNALAGLRAFSYRYKSERDGKGRQVGVMAQDLERAGLGHTVIDTPDGKYVDGAKAATSSLALTAALARRVARLEGKGK